MAFKKREYKQWLKVFDDLLFKNGCNPYLLINDFKNDLIKVDDFEGAKAATDTFKKWFDMYGMSEKQTDAFITKKFSEHPVYGQKPNKIIL